MYAQYNVQPFFVEKGLEHVLCLQTFRNKAYKPNPNLNSFNFNSNPNLSLNPYLKL